MSERLHRLTGYESGSQEIRMDLLRVGSLGFETNSKTLASVPCVPAFLINLQPICRRYSRSHAAGMLSRGEYGPGVYARDAMPCWLNSHTRQSCLLVMSQNSIASFG